MTLMRKLALCLFAAAALAGCDDTGKSSGAKRESDATRQLLDQAAVTVGMPGILNFTEKRQLKMLYELRDQANLATYSYYVDMAGALHKICPSTSVGFGMPFSAQYTAPFVQRDIGQGGALETAQPEPNGLYMPDSTSATWVICLGAKGELSPVYVEPQVIVALTPMAAQP
jgi:hypothetical protein